MLTATVTDDAPDVLVRTDGATTSVVAIALDHYTPVTNDRVLLERVGTQLVIVGKLP